MEKDFLINLIDRLVVKVVFSLISSVVNFTFTSSGSKDFNIKLLSLISFNSGSGVYPVVYASISSKSF